MAETGAPTMRADLALVARGLFESRAKAQEAIAAGLVEADGRLVRRAADRIAAEAALSAQAPYPWVSRGGVKLAAGLDAFGIDPRGRVCLDLGASTGGFTDVLLARGATFVHAVDVGHGQLHPRLRADPRVHSLEKTDVRHLHAVTLQPPPDLLVCDVSFIALSHVLPAALPLVTRPGWAVLLVKPQFEVGPQRVKHGVVRDEAARREAVDSAERLVAARGWRVLGHVVSPITGGDGNVEYLVGAEGP